MKKVGVKTQERIYEDKVKAKPEIGCSKRKEEKVKTRSAISNLLIERGND